jgi:acyl-CoA hydrolase
MTLIQNAESEEEVKTSTIKQTKYGLPIDESYSIAATEERILRASEALKKNGFAVHVVDTLKGARDLVEGLLPLDKEVFTSQSLTVKETGLDEVINGPESKFTSLRKQMEKLDRSTQFRQLVKMGAAPDVIVGSVHAITETGQVFVASGSGSQLGPYSAGAEKAIWVVGSQKLVADFHDAMRRLELYSYPKEDVRMHELANRGSGIGKILIVNREIIPGRITVVIVREPVGF